MTKAERLAKLLTEEKRTIQSILQSLNIKAQSSVIWKPNLVLDNGIHVSLIAYNTGETSTTGSNFTTFGYSLINALHDTEIGPEKQKLTKDSLLHARRKWEAPQFDQTVPGAYAVFDQNGYKRAEGGFNEQG
jgi:hypothetical protein